MATGMVPESAMTADLKPIPRVDPVEDLARRAISAAKSGSWADAVKLNHQVILISPGNAEAYNRLGKALAELGQLGEAIAAFRRALEISPSNLIAQRNVQRLRRLISMDAVVGPSRRRGVVSFVAARGTSLLTELRRPGSADILATVVAGAILELEIAPSAVRVRSASGVALGELDARVARRLTRLLNGGNRYEVSAAGVSSASIKVLLREVYRSPSQRNVVSFPGASLRQNDSEWPDDGSRGTPATASRDGWAMPLAVSNDDEEDSPSPDPRKVIDVDLYLDSLIGSSVEG